MVQGAFLKSAPAMVRLTLLFTQTELPVQTTSSVVMAVAVFPFVCTTCNDFITVQF